MQNHFFAGRFLRVDVDRGHTARFQYLHHFHRRSRQGIFFGHPKCIGHALIGVSYGIRQHRDIESLRFLEKYRLVVIFVVGAGDKCAYLVKRVYFDRNPEQFVIAVQIFKKCTKIKSTHSSSPDSGILAAA